MTFTFLEFLLVAGLAGVIGWLAGAYMGWGAAAMRYSKEETDAVHKTGKT